MCYLGSSKSLADPNCLRDGFSATYFNYAEIVKNRPMRWSLCRRNLPKAECSFDIRAETRVENLITKMLNFN